MTSLKRPSWSDILGPALPIIIGPVDFATSVQDARHQLDYIWRDDTWKQATGYTLIGISAVSLLLSARKRLRWVRLGKFASWRFLHAALGLTTLIGLFGHTGLHMGSNLNFVLMSCFLGLNVVGAVTGITASLENRLEGAWAVRVRQWRPRFTMAHILFFWPLPILVAVHIFVAYYY